MGDAERIGNERRLRAAVLAGDEAAWRQWYDACAADLAGYVRWRCGGQASLADDVLQDAWLVAVRRIRDFDPAAGAFRQWLTGVAVRVLQNHLRKQARQRRGRRELDDPAAPKRDGLRVAEALAALNPRQEAVLRAKYLDGKSVAEIAAECGDSEKAVESLLTRARAAFRAEYDGNPGGG